MRNIKSVLAGIAAAGLLLAHPVQAQEANEFESGLGVPGGSGLLIFLFVLVIIGVGAGLAFEDDENERPASP